jgi:hypothetical protein
MHNNVYALLMAGAIITLIGWWAYAYFDTNRLKNLEFWASEFYSAAEPLAEDPETPLYVLEALSGANWLIGRRTGAAAVINVFSDKTTKSDEQMPDRVRSFLVSRPELARKFADAMSASILAATYSNLWLGPFARDLILVQRVPSTSPAHSVTIAKQIRLKLDQTDNRCAAAA